MSMEHIEDELFWEHPALLNSGKQYREKYRIGYGGNGFHYKLKKRGGKWEAEVNWQNLFTKKNIDLLPFDQQRHITCTLSDMNDWLGSLQPIPGCK